MTDTYTAAVIPAKAGIQTIDNIPTQWDNTLNTALSATRRFDDRLDSGLTVGQFILSLSKGRNDGVVGFAYCGACFERCLQLCKAQ